MQNSENHYEYYPHYLLNERYRELTSQPEEQRNEKEISKIENILQREAPYFLFDEGQNIKT